MLRRGRVRLRRPGKLPRVLSDRSLFDRQDRLNSTLNPSDGYVLVNLDVNNGYAIAGAGSVVILQFQALKSGVTPIALNNITFVDNVTAGASTTTSAHEVLVTVE